MISPIMRNKIADLILTARNILYADILWLRGLDFGGGGGRGVGEVFTLDLHHFSRIGKLIMEFSTQNLDLRSMKTCSPSGLQN